MARASFNNLMMVNMQNHYTVFLIVAEEQR